MKDGEPDFSNYTAEQIDRSLRSIDREEFPLNYANLLAARKALPPPVDAAVIEADQVATLRQAMLTGEVWISASWTWIINTVLPVACVVALSWLARKIAFDPGHDVNAIDVREWSALESFLYGLFGVTIFVVLGWFPLRVRRLVVRNGELEVRSHFARVSISLDDIECVRWNDVPVTTEVRLGLIELRVDNPFGRKVTFFPRSPQIMRALAAQVAAVQGRNNVADPAYRSVFYLGAADP